MPDKNNFEERLLTELRQVAAERPEPAVKQTRWKPATFALGGGSLALAAAAAVIIVGSGGNTTSAYAVEKETDGSVTVEISSLKDAGGLETELRNVGIPAEVDYRPAETIPCGPGAEIPRTGAPEPVELTKDRHGNVEVRKAEELPVGAIPAEPVPAGAKGITVKSVKARPATAVRIEPGAIKDGQKLYLTAPRTGEATGAVRADAPGVAAAIAAPGEQPPC